ncbi:hypothetical protein ACOSOMT5_P0694 [Acidiphilium sp. MT5]
MTEKTTLQKLIDLARRAVPNKLADRARAVPLLERAISEAQAGRRAALVEAERLMARRQSEILDLDDDEIFEIDKAIERAELRAERFDLILPTLAERLNEARSKARRAETETAKSLYITALSSFMESAQTTARFGNDVIKFRDDLTSRGFRELLALPSIPTLGSGAIVLAPDILERLADELDRITNNARPRAEPETAAARATPSAPIAAAASPPIVGRTLPPINELPLMADNDLPVDTNGMVRVSILRAGVEIDGQRLSGIVALPKEKALPLLRRGVADLADE